MSENNYVSNQNFGQVFDQVFGQGFDQGFGEGKYSVRCYPAEGKTTKTLNDVKQI